MTRNLDETTAAIIAADESMVHEAIESVTWERRGLLQRLVRVASRTEVDVEARQSGR
jgi:hypothetical protein